MDADKKKIWVSGQTIEVTDAVYEAYMEHRTALRSKAIATWSLECDLLHTSLNYIVRSILPEQP